MYEGGGGCVAWAVPTAADSLRDNGVCLILLCLRLVLLPPQDQVSGEVALASYLVVLLLLLLCVCVFVCLCVCAVYRRTRPSTSRRVCGCFFSQSSSFERELLFSR